MRPEKQLLLDEIKERVDNSNSFIITAYQDFKSLIACDFRNKIVKAGGDFEIVRKRMFIKAAETINLEIKRDLLKGHVGVVFSKGDIVEAAKTVVGYDKEHKDVIKVLGGFSEGKFLDAQQVKVISTLPDKDSMRAQILGLFEAPMSQTLATMEALLTSVIHCLDNKAKKSEQ